MDVTELSMLLDSINAAPVSAGEFTSASKNVRSLQSLDEEQQLLLYGLYKQSTIGDLNIPKPSEDSDVAVAAKWTAWSQLEGFPMTSAAQAYVHIVNELLMGNSDVTEMLLSTNGPGFNNDNPKGIIGGTFSSLNNPTKGEESWSDQESIFISVVNNDINSLEKIIQDKSSLDVKDKDGLSPLHFAVDRGYEQIVELLLKNGANVNAMDGNLLTPLAYAVNCEHLDVIKLLLQYGADVTLQNAEGQSVTEYEGISSEILKLLTNN